MDNYYFSATNETDFNAMTPVPSNLSDVGPGDHSTYEEVTNTDPGFAACVCTAMVMFDAPKLINSYAFEIFVEGLGSVTPTIGNLFRAEYFDGVTWNTLDQASTSNNGIWESFGNPISPPVLAEGLRLFMTMNSHP